MSAGCWLAGCWLAGWLWCLSLDGSRSLCPSLSPSGWLALLVAFGVDNLLFAKGRVALVKSETMPLRWRVRYACYVKKRKKRKKKRKKKKQKTKKQKKKKKKQ
ncbi:hypothetical protein BZA05DRAFT_416018 [Tricharina praecox]|uniref:uncharacterized protein n=1 Tax=Tricharina praecox TaxID=43433 RepID=UPI00221FEB01|nr:uncharacterized protein BZA05DRAFT_416018 [Tricharina praecox]KAI5856318.1 hypothetical protein BZA05DRAFT_416018 [Tricharina praecox]